jgi:hypothetical protein
MIEYRYSASKLGCVSRRDRVVYFSHVTSVTSKSPKLELKAPSHSPTTPEQPDVQDPLTKDPYVDLLCSYSRKLWS